MLKKLASCIGEYKRDSIFAPLFVTCEVILEVIIPVLMAYIIDFGVEKGNMTVVYVTGTILIVLVGLSMLCGALSGKFAASASAGFAKNLRKRMFHSIQNFSFSNIDKFSTSGLVTRLTTDVTNLQHAYQMIIRIAVRCPAMLIFSNVSLEMPTSFISVTIPAEIAAFASCTSLTSFWVIFTSPRPSSLK